MTTPFEVIRHMSTSGNDSTGPTLAESIGVSEFKAKCLAIMEDVRERGVEYVVTKRGQPIARVVPMGDAALDPLGFLGGTLLEEHDIVSPDHELWEGSEE